MDRPTILIAIDGEDQAYLDALENAGFAPTRAIGASPRTASVDLAVIDCDLGPEVATAIYTAVNERQPVPVLLILGEGTELPEGLGRPSDELALKPLPAEALVYRLQALLIRMGRHVPAQSAESEDSADLGGGTIGEGHAVSVFAPKGGVGKTTIAVNMAVALRQQTRAEVLLLDADVGVGNVTSVLDVPYRLGLADLADSPPEQWTDAAFDQCASTHAASGVRVLTWGTDPAESERVSVDLLLAALRWGRNHHSYVIIDNHPGYDDRTMAMLAVANEIFLVVTPEMGALRNSSQFMDLARELGLASVVRVIVNRANHGIHVKDIASSLGMPIAATIMSNGPKAVIALNEGVPLITKFPREKVSTDLHHVARLISQPQGSPVAADAAAPRWWTRFGTRPSNA